MPHRLRILALMLGAFSLCALPQEADAGRRGLLWRVIQTCVANNKLTGGAFPCLAVDTSEGRAAGHAVIRAPLDRTHIIVTPTVRIVGIEAARLRGSSAPNYFAEAWAARRYIGDALGWTLDRGDLALAVNSRPGRSQDQLHIHVDCVLPDVKAAVLRALPTLSTRKWTALRPRSGSPRYFALALPNADFAGLNLFDLVATGLDIAPDEMDETTIVAVGVDDVKGAPGFVVLARQRIPDSNDEAHGEALLDNNCRALTASAKS